MFERTFGCYIMESAEAKALRTKATEIEGELESARNTMTLGATINGEFQELSSVGLRNKVSLARRSGLAVGIRLGLRAEGWG